ncbi:GntR family transcriptional regulator [Aeromicrobium chenweiae]|uniref:GntR family transcriptional regulator n=1 Tax=Aeromicrobium chenweiae TaxID=2079793 RepID=A0A2S0WRA3_9ACTN|nr:GntR family transcriptional regulator [Aeromicrobium chenweiae]AWB93842.1 GntR family transcriptional regulator [Aeromicrobium chenweiae]TGN30887.1 GntR family transcriptional regulator [Aeromicrobium chenweiae]
MSDVTGTELSRDATFSHRTETLIREMILSGTVAPGERLNEVALASSLGISRGPLREAIQHLAGEGLLTMVSHRGAFVRTFEPRELDELYDMRSAFEMYAARLVCRRATDEQIAELDAFVSETAEAMSSEADGRYPADRDFHRRLLGLSGNATLERAALETQAQIVLARSMSAKAPVRAKEALGEHADIVAALQSRSPDEAARLVNEHLDRARRSALAALGFDD